jgi:hypothetical protein
MLTSPKLKDLVNKPQEKYNTIYNSLKSTGDVGIENVREDNKSNLGGVDGSNSSSMKDELKKYLKELNFSNNSSSGALNTNTNTGIDIPPCNNEDTNSIYSQNNIMTGVGANGISTRVNNIPNYLPSTNTSNPIVAPDYGTPTMSSSYSSAYSTY